MNTYLNANDDTLPIYTLQKSGIDNENFVILFLGDGYTENQQDDFLRDVKLRCDKLLVTEPFRQYSDKINVYAVGAISEESGVSYSDKNKKNTYFNVYKEDVYTTFKGDGYNKAYNIKTQLEENILDKGGVIGTIHVLSNTNNYFGFSLNSLFSFSTVTDLVSSGSAAIHEMAHSIGKLLDEYKATQDGVNTSISQDISSLPWKKFFGFRGIGYTHNNSGSPGYIPSPSCIMNDLSVQSFCEVCKLELAKRLNSYLYTQVSDKYYVANPDLTIEHPENTLGSEYNKYRVTNGNLKKANKHTLELRTVVQNLTNQPQTLRLSLKIIDPNGEYKLSKSEEFTLSPLPDYAMYEFEYEPAKQSLSIKIDNIHGIDMGDTVLGEVIDCATNSVIATDKTETAPRSKINIHHKLKTAEGTYTPMPNTYTTTLYVHKNTTYTFKEIQQLNDCAYIGNSINQKEIFADSDSIDIDFYYTDEKPYIEASVTSDKTSFNIRPVYAKNGNVIILTLYNGNSLCEIKTFIYDGSDIAYTTKEKYTTAKIMLWKSLKSLVPLAVPIEIG